MLCIPYIATSSLPSNSVSPAATCSIVSLRLASPAANPRTVPPAAMECLGNFSPISHKSRLMKQGTSGGVSRGSRIWSTTTGVCLRTIHCGSAQRQRATVLRRAWLSFRWCKKREASMQVESKAQGMEREWWRLRLRLRLRLTLTRVCMCAPLGLAPLALQAIG